MNHRDSVTLKDGRECVIRPVTVDDTERFYHMMCRLDEETEYMMYEPGERQARTRDLSRLRAVVEGAASGADLLLVAVNDREEIIGYIWAERGKLNRMLHTAYIVIGIRRAFRRQGLGSQFLYRLDDWAESSGIVRLELTVECENTGAKTLYEKHGFQVEGLREKSMNINGRLVDEFYMGKIMNDSFRGNPHRCLSAKKAKGAT